MKNVMLALIALSMIKNTYAQKLDGEYKGFFIMKGDPVGCSVEMTIKQSGNNLTGKTVYNIGENKKLGTTFTGTFNSADSTFSITDVNTTECTGTLIAGSSCYGCKKSITGKWTENNSIGILKAVWQPKTDNTVGDCYTCPSIATCSTGVLEIRKNHRLTEGLLFFLGQWKNKKTYETNKQWQSRKDSIPLIKEVTNNYLENTMQWSNAVLVYDPETEKFTITSTEIAPYTLSVKREDARCFAENFKTATIAASYSYDAVHQVISVITMIVRIKCYGIYKTYQ